MADYLVDIKPTKYSQIPPKHFIILMNIDKMLIQAKKLFYSKMWQTM